MGAQSQIGHLVGDLENASQSSKNEAISKELNMQTHIYWRFQMKHYRNLVVIFGVVIFLISCSSESDLTSIPVSPTKTAPTITNTPLPTETPTQPPTKTPTGAPTATSTQKVVPTATSFSNSGLYLSLDTGLESLTSLTFSDDGRYLAASDNDGKVSVWETSTGDHMFDIDVYDLLMVLFSPDGEYLATLGRDWVDLWQVEDGEWVDDYLCTDELEMKIQFTPGGDLAISGILNEEQVNLTYLPSNEQKIFFSQNADAWIKEATLAPDGEVIALGRSDGVIELQDANNGNLLWMIEAHSDWVLNLAFSPDSQLLVSDSFSFDPAVKVWQVEDGSLVSVPENEKWDPGRLAFSPDGSFLTSYSSYGTKLWKTDDWSLYAQRPSFVRFSPDGVFFAEPENKGVSIWHLQSAAIIDSFAPSGLRDVAFPPSEPLPFVALGIDVGKVELHQLMLNGTTTQEFGTTTPQPAQELYAAIDATYGEVLGDQYIEWDESMQVFLLHGFVGEAVNFDPLPIQTRQGDVLGTAIGTVRLFNLHQGNQNSVLVPLAIELPDGTVFMPGLGDPIPDQQMNEFLTSLREDQFIGQSITILIAPDADTAQEALSMSDIFWQNDLITTYQESWEMELNQMLETGQAVTVNGQDIMLIPIWMWFDVFDAISLP